MIQSRLMLSQTFIIGQVFPKPNRTTFYLEGVFSWCLSVCTDEYCDGVPSQHLVTSLIINFSPCAFAIANNWTLSGVYWIKAVPELLNKLHNFCGSRNFIPCLWTFTISSNLEPVQSNLLSYTFVLWDSHPCLVASSIIFTKIWYAFFITPCVLHVRLSYFFI